MVQVADAGVRQADAELADLELRHPPLPADRHRDRGRGEPAGVR